MSNKHNARLDKRKADMIQDYISLYNQGFADSLIIEKIAVKYYRAAQTVREILRPRTLREQFAEQLKREV